MPTVLSEPAGWHTLNPQDALSATASSRAGLASREIHERHARYGHNLLAPPPARSALSRVAAQVGDVMILLLLAAAALALAIGEVGDAVAILAIVVLNAAIGLSQERRTERALDALEALSAPSAHVIRDGLARLVPAADLVPGDVVRLEAGMMVPADLRLLDSSRLRIDESALTGESTPVDKLAASVTRRDTALGDRLGMAYRGTVATYGRGLGVVVATGMATELGQVAALLRRTEQPPTPLQARLAQLGRRLAVAAVLACAMVLLAGVARGEPPLRMLLTAISLAVAAIPEALPAVMTLALALGARRMAAEQALVRSLPAVEALGSVTVICADKTGTLTENRMRVEAFYCDGNLQSTAGSGPCWHDFLAAMTLCSDVEEGPAGALVGDPTEVALAEAARAAGVDRARLAPTHRPLAELPFEAERRMMTTIHAHAHGHVVSYTKGAVEEILARTEAVAGSGARRPSTLDVQETADALAAEGFRVLAVAERRWPALPADLAPERVECGLTFLGLVGLLDPPREEAIQAIATCRRAGIEPVMITGDHPLTARAVARRLGLPADREAVLTGAELEACDDEELMHRAGHVRVYARVAPEQKLKIVRALQARGEVVAMTGDGVNDAPALRRADIGVAMGRGGTDAAREAAAMVLLDDNFATIVRAVHEGRRIYANARRFMRYITATNTAEVLTVFLAPLLGMPLPLLPLQILWINLVTDSAPALALAVEPAEPSLMRQRPRPRREGLFARGMGVQVAWAAGLMAAVTLAVQAFGLATGRASWQTMAFTVLCLSQLANAAAVRSEVASPWTGSRPLLLALGTVTALQMAVIYVPPLARVFGTVALTAGELAIAVAASGIIFAAIEVEKKVLRRRGRR